MCHRRVPSSRHPRAQQLFVPVLLPIVKHASVAIFEVDGRFLTGDASLTEDSLALPSFYFLANNEVRYRLLPWCSVTYWTR